DHEADPRPDLGQARRDVPEPDGLVEARRERSAGDDADGLAGRLAALPFADRVAVARRAAVPDLLEPDELPGKARRLDPDQRRLPEEVARLVELHDPAEAGLERVRRLVDLVAVERQASLEAQRVARAEPGGLEAERLARLDERAPELRCRLVVGEELE